MKTAERLARVCFALALLVSTSSCRYVLGLDDPPGASACVRASDCNSGESCQQNKCVCTGSSCGDGSADDGHQADAPPTPDAAQEADAKPETVTDAALADAAPADGHDEATPPPPPTVSVATVLCAGQSYVLHAQVDWGAAPYTWTISGDPEITLTPGSESGARLDFNPTHPGSYTFNLKVSDASGQSVAKDVPLSVAEPPEVVADPLPPTCVGQPYNTALKARGGSGSYTWTTEVPANVTVVEGVLSTVPSSEGPLTFTATVSDGTCTSARQTLTLAVAKAGTTTCPTILPETLPAPCLDNPYTYQEIKGSGGTTPYTWKVIESSAGLVFDTDPKTLKLSGLPTASGKVTLELTDAEGRRSQRSYIMTPRTTCWLGYSTVAAAGSTFNLYDHVLEAKRSFSPAESGAVVTDFKFSPNGQFVVFSARTPSGATSFYLLSAPRWTAQPLDTGGDVLDYAWSDASSVLAVMYQTAQGTRLGGFDFSNAAQPSHDAAITGLRQLAPIAVTAAAPKISWYGDAKTNGLVFATPSRILVNGLVPGYTTLGATSFNLPQLMDHAPYFTVPKLRRAGAGFFAFADLSFDYYDPANNTWITFVDGSPVPDPAGIYVATVLGDQLTLYLSNPEGNNPVASPWTQTSGCGLLLAWAGSKERIACVSPPVVGDAGSSADPHTVVAFDITAGSKTTTQVGPVKGVYAYPIGNAKERRRLFSPSGEWLAMTTDDSLLIATFVGGTPRLYAKVPATDATVTSELAFAPDERGLLWSHGGHMLYLELNQSNEETTPRWVNSRTVAVARPCIENFADDPDAWCGTPPAISRVAWSPDSQVAATLDAAGSISTFEPADFNQPRVPNTACEAACSPHYEFQPRRTVK
jgi:hypothetical protein